jgi:hypothetical protein
MEIDDHLREDRRILFIPMPGGVRPWVSMLDPKILRESPDVVRAAIAKKHLIVDLTEVLALDTAWRALVAEVETLRAKQKAANNEMAALPKGSPGFIAKVQEMKAVSTEIKAKDEGLKQTEEKLHTAMLAVPNIPHSSVPEGLRHPRLDRLGLTPRASPLGNSRVRECDRFCPRGQGDRGGVSVFDWRRRQALPRAAAVFLG